MMCDALRLFWQGGMVTLLRDHVAVTGKTLFGALAAASHPRN